MSDFDANRALAILNRASENGMYDPTKIPEADADKIAAAEQTVQLCQQVEQVVHAAFPGETDERVIAQKVPHWPGVVKTLAEAHVFVGANEPPPETSDTPDPSAASVTYQEDYETDQRAEAPAEQESIVKDRPDWIPSVAVEPNPPVQEEPESIPIAPQQAPDQEDPKNGEVWLDQRGNAWLIVSYSGGTSAEVKSMKSGEATIVPAGFLKRRYASQEASDYADPPVADPPRPVELLKPVSESPTPASITPVTPTWEGVKSDPAADVEKFAEGVRAESDRMNAPQLPVPPPSPEERQQVAEPRRIIEMDANGDPLPPEDPNTDASIESAKYDDLVENVEQRYRPAGMPVPTDLVDPPTISSEQFADIDDATARILHARFNALAARAKYLHDVEAAIARECDLVKTYHMRGAMAIARRELGKDATVAEVKIVAEGDQLVYKWADYSRIHSEEAKALKTFHDIYTQHVVVLSRDWSMREAQVR